jgi:hypothetical protein
MCMLYSNFIDSVLFCVSAVSYFIYCRNFHRLSEYLHHIARIPFPKFNFCIPAHLPKFVRFVFSVFFFMWEVLFHPLHLLGTRIFFIHVKLFFMMEGHIWDKMWYYSLVFFKFGIPNLFDFFRCEWALFFTYLYKRGLFDLIRWSYFLFGYSFWVHSKWPEIPIKRWGLTVF